MSPSSPEQRVAPFWPYDWRKLEEGLDTETIEKQGEFWLYRGLNIKRLIAFIGSGVSMAYGRVTWNEIATLHIDRMCEFGDGGHFKELPEAQELVAYVREVRKKPGTLGSDELYTALQACEQVWRLITANGNIELLGAIANKFRLDLKSHDEKFKLERVEPAERGSRLFRYWIKRETYDELPHVKRLLHGWTPSSKKDTKKAIPPPSITDTEKAIPPQILNNCVDARASDPQELLRQLGRGFEELDGKPRDLLRRRIGDAQRAYHVFFQKGFLDAVERAAAEDAPSGPRSKRLMPIVKIHRALAAELQRGVGTDKSLRPVRRFALGLVLDIERLISLLKGRRTSAQTVPKDKDKIPPVPRADIIPVEHDPLRRLAYDLGISRYMTTNYDLEVERLFADMGFSIPPDTTADGPDVDEVEAIGPSGGRTRDLVLTERSAIDLVDFAANDSAHEFQVVHLHGRATEHHDIVVTEADYQKTYVSGKPSQQAFRQGLEVAFGGNPILFVGLGLSEGDVMRPLREFMTDTNPGRDNRAIVALRDGREDALTRKTFVKRAYAQYGVHVLHYGFKKKKQEDGQPTKKQEDREKDADWLAKVGDAVKKTVSDLRMLSEALKTYADCVPPLRKTTTKKKRTLNKEAENKRKATEALEVIQRFGLDPKRPIEGRGKDGRFTVVPSNDDFESDGAECNIAFESEVLRLVDALVSNIAQLAYDAREESVPYGGMSRAELARHLSEFVDRSLRPAVQRAEGAIVTAALNAKLQSIKDGWVDWWKNWRSEPKTRTHMVRYERLDSGDSAGPIWTRHFASDNPTPSGSTESSPKEKPSVEGLEHFFLAVNKLNSDLRGRRVFMLLGSQGAGKGNIYNSFAECGDRLLGGKSMYSAQFFTSFSFSIEIASVWDALLSFLHKPKGDSLNLFLDASSDDAGAGGLLGLSRVDALRRVLHKLSGPDASGERLLVVLNAFDILLDENGEPKSSEIRRILQLLLGMESRKAPLDIVCICRDRRIHGLYLESTAGVREPSRTLAGETSPFVGPSFEEGPALQGQTLTLLLSETQRKFGEGLTEGDETGRIHGDFLSSLRSMGSFVRLHRAAVHDKPWLEKELGVKPGASAANANYVHILDLSNPIEFDWLTFDSAKERLLSAAYEALKEVGRIRSVEKKDALRRLFRVHLQRRRFLYTLIVAIAALVKEDEKLTLFLRNLIPTLRGPGVSVQDRVVEAVLDFWFDRPRLKEPDAGETDPVLWEELLRHLAVITTPVTADVLALCPQIAEHIDRKQSANLRDSAIEEERIRQVSDALRSLVRRGLIFNLQPAGSHRGHRKSEADPRYVVHRAIQRYVYRKLGSQRLEPSESSTFTLSLYTAQQRNYPRLNAASYAFLYNLVHALSGFPTDHRNAHSKRAQASKMLRAALGVTRNLLSVGVVSRFSDFDEPNINKSATSGHFQHHWFIVRWLLSYAQDLDRKRDGLKRMSEEKDKSPNNWLPFYRDELVWLANECGAFSYFQGQTYDAAALYWLASRLQRNIESLRPGAQRSRLFLNDAWCSIDRARLDDAEAMLKDVYETVDEEKVLRLVARGGLALISNIRGRTDLALAEYNYTIDEMQKMQRSRPLSIIQRHRGDLRRHLRDRDEAEKDFVRAIETAETSGYIDLVHTTQVARVRNLIEVQKDPSTLTEVLDAAHAYAERMAIPRLLCEVLMVRAELLLKQGQSDIAGQFANRATRIATLNGLTLRKIAYLELLARVEKAQGNVPSAERLLSRTVRFARQVGYNLMVERVERERNELAYAREWPRP